MNRLCFGIIVLAALGQQNVHADDIKINENDTIKTYQMGEVVISSSTKETNNIQKLPGSVTILSPQMISGRQIEAIKDISSFVPNLYIPDYGAKLTSAIYIRGIGTRSSGQSVGLYVDNVPYLDKSTFDFELTDIQRIEVLRGPQGTLYGRNAMGGIINISTISPFDFQGKKISLSAGNYGQYNVKASHYAKLNEKFGFTAAAYYDHNSGFYTNVFNGKKIDKADNVGGRLKLEGRFNPNFRLAYSFSADYADQGAFPYRRFTGKGNTDYHFIDPVNINDQSSYERLMFANNLSLEYKNDRFILSSITGHQFFKDDMNMDQDFSPLPVFTIAQKQKQNTISEELAFKSNTMNDYQWSFGLYGFYNSSHTEAPVNFKETGIKNILQPVFDQLKEKFPKMPYLKITDERLAIPGDFNLPSYGLALYHQSTYNNLFVDGLSITAGIRLDYEKQKMDYFSQSKMHMGFSFAENGPIIDMEKFFEIPTSVIDQSISQDFWEVLPKVSLKYECTPNTFTYFTVAKGYKTGGYNIQMSADVMQNQMRYDMMNSLKGIIPTEIPKPAPLEDVAAYKPEKSWNYELGVKSNLLDHRLTAELTGFFTNIQDVQLTKFVKSGSGRLLTNAGKARSYGVEASFRAHITNNLSADVNYGYTCTEFKDYNNGKTDFSGNAVPYIPRHTLNIGLHYTRLLHGKWIDQFSVSTQFAGVGKIYWTEHNNVYQKFYGTLNAKAGIRKGVVNLNVWSKNLTNTHYSTFYFESFGTPLLQTGKPFQIGAEVAIAF